MSCFLGGLNGHLTHALSPLSLSLSLFLFEGVPSPAGVFQIYCAATYRRRLSHDDDNDDDDLLSHEITVAMTFPGHVRRVEIDI